LGKDFSPTNQAGKGRKLGFPSPNRIVGDFFPKHNIGEGLFFPKSSREGKETWNSFPKCYRGEISSPNITLGKDFSSPNRAGKGRKLGIPSPNPILGNFFPKHNIGEGVFFPKSSRKGKETWISFPKRTYIPSP